MNDFVTAGGGPPGDPNGELSAMPATGLIRMIAELRAEKAALIDAMRDEMDEGLRLRELGGARPDENITAMTERVIRERAALQAKCTRLQGLLDACHKICGELARPSGI